jgi:hypothetical protein
MRTAEDAPLQYGSRTIRPRSAPAQQPAVHRLRACGKPRVIRWLLLASNIRLTCCTYIATAPANRHRGRGWHRNGVASQGCMLSLSSRHDTVDPLVMHLPAHCTCICQLMAQAYPPAHGGTRHRPSERLHHSQQQKLTQAALTAEADTEAAVSTAQCLNALMCLML